MIRRKLGLLRDIAQACPLADRNIAAIGLDAPLQDLKQRRFAGAIGADEADPVAVVHDE